MSRIKLLLDVIDDLSALTESLLTLAQAVAGDAPEEAKPESTPAEPPKKTLTLEDVRTFLAEKSRQGFTDDVRSLLKKYGADTLSGVDPKHYEALIRDAEVLGNAT